MSRARPSVAAAALAGAMALRRVQRLTCLVLILMVMAHPAGATVPDNLPELRALALELVNAAREEHGLDALGASQTLDRAAQAHAEDMLRRQYFDHVSPEGGSVRDRYIDAGGSRSQLVAENIAQCTGCGPAIGPARIRRFQEGWMASPGHRENILRSGVSQFGFGVATGPDGVIKVVQTFAGAGQAGKPSKDGSSEVLASQALADRLLGDINQRRKEAGVPALAASAALAEAARSLLGEGGASLGDGGRLREALPPDERRNWRSVVALSASCSGCGAEPTASDATLFRRQWSDAAQPNNPLLDPDMTHFGSALAADGEGGKTAIAILGGRR